MAGFDNNTIMLALFSDDKVKDVYVPEAKTVTTRKAIYVFFLSSTFAEMQRTQNDVAVLRNRIYTNL